MWTGASARRSIGGIEDGGNFVLDVLKTAAVQVLFHEAESGLCLSERIGFCWSCGLYYNVLGYANSREQRRHKYNRKYFLHRCFLFTCTSRLPKIAATRAKHPNTERLSLIRGNRTSLSKPPPIDCGLSNLAVTIGYSL